MPNAVHSLFLQILFREIYLSPIHFLKIIFVFELLFRIASHVVEVNRTM